MVDTRRARFLDSCVPSLRGADRAALIWGLALILAVSVAASGCSPQPRPAGKEESLTSGRISIVCAPEARRLIARELSAFQALYPQAQFDVRTGSSQEAVRALYAAECNLAVITRELNDEERSAALKGKLELEGYGFGRDAIVAIVNPANPVQNMALDELAMIYTGERSDWSQFGAARGPIVPVVQPVDSDVTGFFAERVMKGRPWRARALTEPTDSAAVARVLADPRAIAYVRLEWAERGARALALAPLTGLPYWHPDPEAVYKGEYPLSRTYNFYVRADGPPLANGVITYATSREGQALVHEEGLVPTAVPVRFVRRSPMMSSH